MDRILKAYLDSIQNAGSVDQLRSALIEVASHLGLSSVAYLALSGSDKPLLISNYNASWTSHYVAHGYHLFDPVIRKSLWCPNPFGWGPDCVRPNSLPAIRRFFHEAADFGIRYGHTFPSGQWRCGQAAMTFATDRRGREYQNCIRSHAAALQLISLLFHAEVQNMRDPGLSIEGVSLSRRQLQCLEWAARGKSVGEVAQLLGITRPTAKYHLDRAKAKLGVKTNLEAGIAFKKNRTD
jgi:DNA-binding CsgD family transcriptional regulator